MYVASQVFGILPMVGNFGREKPRKREETQEVGDTVSPK